MGCSNKRLGQIEIQFILNFKDARLDGPRIGYKSINGDFKPIGDVLQFLLELIGKTLLLASGFFLFFNKFIYIEAKIILQKIMVLGEYFTRSVIIVMKVVLPMRWRTVAAMEKAMVHEMETESKAPKESVRERPMAGARVMPMAVGLEKQPCGVEEKPMVILLAAELKGLHRFHLFL